jgi:hypothetical protein
MTLFQYYKWKSNFSCGGPDNAPWSPSKVVPDCVSEDTTLSTYDVTATINYRSTGSAVGDECEGEYINAVQQHFENIGQVLDR